ncbi:MAG TPA: Spy/CpxP family protein refolding chaperone [Acidobacteriaceae bacterium]|nr:Spy/CpxP family protein refolding chaperone [Acidobacteriaceae bacterium]
MNKFLTVTLACLVSSGFALAQGMGGPPPGPGGPGGPGGHGGHDGFGRGPMQRTFHDDHFGRWWNDPHLAQQIGITDDQKHKMDDIFQQHRLNLIDLNANLEKQQVLMQPMISADQPNEADVLAQIDKIAQARADLEKANARMLFDIRKVLTQEQWQKLKAMRMEHRDDRMMRDHRRGPGGPGGPGGPDGQMGWKHRPGAPPPPNGSAPAPAPQAPAPPQEQ